MALKFKGVWSANIHVYLYKYFILVDHLILWWISGYYGYRDLAVCIVLLGITAILSGIKGLIKIYMVVLLTVAALLAFFLYAGIVDTTIAEAKKMYTTAFEKAKEHEDQEAIEYVMEVERAQKCCGINSWKDYVYGVLESCCTTPPCRKRDNHKLGCAEALDSQRGFLFMLGVLTISLIISLSYFIHKKSL